MKPNYSKFLVGCLFAVSAVNAQAAGLGAPLFAQVSGRTLLGGVVGILCVFALIVGIVMIVKAFTQDDAERRKQGLINGVGCIVAVPLIFGMASWAGLPIGISFSDIGLPTR